MLFIFQWDENTNYFKLSKKKSGENEHKQEAVNLQEEALWGEDDNIESPCCIVSYRQLRGRNQQQTVLQSCTVMHISYMFLCVNYYVHMCMCVCSGDDDNSWQGQITEIECRPDDYTAVCMMALGVCGKYNMIIVHQIAPNLRAGISICINNSAVILINTHRHFFCLLQISAWP